MTANTSPNSAGPNSAGSNRTAPAGEQADEQAGEQADVIELDLPLQHRHASTVRVVAASLAADVGFTVDEIDDLRLGVNEAVAVLADVDADADARLHLRFAVVGPTLTVTATRRGVAEAITAEDVDALAMRILRAVVDEFRVDADGAFVVVKRAGTDGD